MSLFILGRKLFPLITVSIGQPYIGQPVPLLNEDSFQLGDVGRASCIASAVYHMSAWPGFQFPHITPPIKAAQPLSDCRGMRPRIDSSRSLLLFPWWHFGVFCKHLALCVLGWTCLEGPFPDSRTANFRCMHLIWNIWVRFYFKWG